MPSLSDLIDQVKVKVAEAKNPAPVLQSKGVGLSGIGKVKVEAMQKAVNAAHSSYLAGTISEAEYQGILSKVGSDYQGVLESDKQKTLAQHVEKIAPVAGGLVVGALTGGLGAAALGFASAAAASSASGGVAPAALVEPVTPPYVPPGSVNAPAATAKAPHPLLLLVLFVVGGAWVFKKLLR